MTESDRRKWPLRFQIIFPMTLLMFATVVGLSTFHFCRSASLQLEMTEQQIRSVAQTLEESSFPLTDNILKQMRGLAGAEFVLVDDLGNIKATTQLDWDIQDLPNFTDLVGVHELRLSNPIQLHGSSFLHAAFRMRPQDANAQGNSLHIFYPQDLFERQRRLAMFPSIIIGGLALVMTIAAASIIASWVTRPMSELGEQVTRVAKGDFAAMPLPATNDEVRELSVAINEMARMLEAYEDTVRRTEQVRTLGQLGGALAHQLRNSATGTRLALDIHRAECPSGEQSDSLDVATAQLHLMEKYIKKFLSFGARQSRPQERLNFVGIVEALLPLLEPTAKHAGVTLASNLPNDPAFVMGERDGLEHAILNLLLNAIDAATASEDPDRRVNVNVQVEGESLSFTTVDSGIGPSTELATSMFEPFVTNKPDGVGLGLAIAKQVVETHRGEITWKHDGGTTMFCVTLPMIECKSSLDTTATCEGDAHAEAASH